MVENLLDAVAPTNLGFTNPEVLKETIDRGGANLVTGGRRFIRDASNGRLPAMVDTSRFQVGGNLAVSEGSIVLRTDVFELIQYRPATGEVYETPLLIVPPTINKFYIVDLAPGRSLVEYLVGQGHQVFCISWRNPDSEHGHFDFDTYADAVLEARAAAAEIASRESVNVMAACSGGIITAGALGHLADEGKLGEVSSLTLMVSALDNAQKGTAEALASKPIAAAAVAESARRGYLSRRGAGNVFSWLRPNDLIWNYVVNNYLLGKEPPAFDILYWNQDAVRMTAGLHRDFVTMALDNALATPGGMRVLGTEVDLGRVDVDTYIVAGVERPHRRLAQRLSLDAAARRRQPVRAVHQRPHPGADQPATGAGTSPAPATASRETNPPDIADWEAQAVTHRGSWWPDYIAWLAGAAGGAGACAEEARQPRPQGDGEGAGHVRDGVVTEGAEPIPPGRWWGDHVGETRWVLEAARLAVDPVWHGRGGIPRGDGRAVVLVPGFGGGDYTLAALAEVAAADRLPAGRLRLRAQRRLLRARARARGAAGRGAARRLGAARGDRRPQPRRALRPRGRGAPARARVPRRVAGADLQAMFHCSALMLAAVEGRGAGCCDRPRPPPGVPHVPLPLHVHPGFRALPGRPRAADEHLLQGRRRRALAGPARALRRLRRGDRQPRRAHLQPQELPGDRRGAGGCRAASG